MPEKKSTEIPESEIKRLYRSKHDRMISGVCGGFAEYLNTEAVLIRIAWVVITLFGGIGLLMYIAALIIIPENPEHIEEEKEEPNKNEKALFWGAALIIIGIGLLLKQMGFFYYINFWNVPWQMIWAVFLILIGVFLLYNRFPFNTEQNNETSMSDDSQDKRQVYRSTENKMISGVCGGLADYFNVDAALVRLGWVLLTLASVGVGIIAYIIMVIVFPIMPGKNDISVTERKK